MIIDFHKTNINGHVIRIISEANLEYLKTAVDNITYIVDMQNVVLGDLPTIQQACMLV